MAVLTSEAVVLRTWPVQEADLVVSFFTRDYGRVKGIAKSALKSRKRFGGALEPMTVARAFFAERPRQELVRLDQLEILRSPLAQPVDHARIAVLSFFAELLDEALPEHDPQETVFRLLMAVLEYTTAQTPAQSLDPRPQTPDPISPGPWMALTYFQLWMTRLMGLLPDIGRCTACGDPLGVADALRAPGAPRPSEGPGNRNGEPTQRNGSGIYFHAHSDGLYCPLHRAPGASLLSPDSWLLAQRMLRAPASAFATEPWPRRRAQDLRRFTLQSLERHLERKLRTAEALNRLGG